MSYLIDTNVISEMVKKEANKKVMEWIKAVPSESLYLSVISLGEIRKGIEKITDSRKKEKLRIWLEHELPAWFGHRILNIDKHVMERWGKLHAEAKRSIPAIDSLIAATALHHDLAIVTRNAIDFNFPGLEVINPWI